MSRTCEATPAPVPKPPRRQRRRPGPSGRSTALAVAAVVLLSGPARGQSTDRVKTAAGIVSGTVIEMTPRKVVIKKGTGKPTEIDVDKIRSITFAGEPKQLNQIRLYLAGGRLAEAQQALAEVDATKIDRREVRQEVEYYRALCAARRALAGQGPLDAAGKAMYEFLRQNEGNYHFFAACEVLGNLLMRRGSFDKAEVFYRKAAAAPGTDAKRRAGLAVARALQAQGQPAAALTELETVLRRSTDDPAGQAEQTAATVLKAVCLAETGKADAGIEILTDLIVKTDPQQARIQALAYNGLGNCYLKAGRTKDALLAFLHVDVLYNRFPASHAEALARLAPLWEAVGKPERARQARELLHRRYANSRWAR